MTLRGKAPSDRNWPELRGAQRGPHAALVPALRRGCEHRCAPAGEHDAHRSLTCHWCPRREDGADSPATMLQLLLRDTRLRCGGHGSLPSSQMRRFSGHRASYFCNLGFLLEKSGTCLQARPQSARHSLGEAGAPSPRSPFKH